MDTEVLEFKYDWDEEATPEIIRHLGCESNLHDRKIKREMKIHRQRI